MNNTLYTIGYSNLTFNEFLEEINNFNINYLLDVRSIPYSKHAKSFNKEILSTLLKKNNIEYKHMGKYFGARQDNRSLYTNSGYIDYEKMVKNNLFRIGLESVMKGIERGNNIVLMCAEKDPIDCHRAIMISREFAKKGVIIKHIMGCKDVITQKELEYRMLKMYFPDSTQINLFNDKQISEEEKIKECYRMRNKEIGYRKSEEENDHIYNGLY